MATPMKPSKKPATSARNCRGTGAISPRRLRQEYGIDRPLFARLLGIAEETLGTWEARGRVSREGLAKLRKVRELLKGLNRVMPRDAIACWLVSPNDASRSAGARTPADLMANGRYDKIEAMIYFFESGVPF